MQLVLIDTLDYETKQKLNQPLDFKQVALSRDCFLQDLLQAARHTSIKQHSELWQINTCLASNAQLPRHAWHMESDHLVLSMMPWQWPDNHFDVCVQCCGWIRGWIRRLANQEWKCQEDVLQGRRLKFQIPCCAQWWPPFKFLSCYTTHTTCHPKRSWIRRSAAFCHALSLGCM